MSNKLGIGDSFPDLTINLVSGGTLDLPELRRAVKVLLVAAQSADANADFDFDA